jgi:hypothetical protein
VEKIALHLRRPDKNRSADERPCGDKTTQPLLPLFEKESVETINVGSTETINDISELNEASPSGKYRKRRMLDQQLLFL